MKAQFLVLAMVLGLVSVLSVKADTVTIVVGESGLGLTPQVVPFFSPFAESIRYQQVYDSSAFGPIPLRIVRLTFRLIETAIPFSTVIPDIQINLSTTPRAVDGLSGTFADNVGTDDTIVLNRGMLSLSSAGTGLFDIIIDLHTPFVYDPALGNLLLDVRNFTNLGLCCPFFDATSPTRSGDPVSKLFAPDVASDSGFENSVGLVTQFTVELALLPVTLDIKPGSDPNSINCNNHNGVIPVAILTTEDFDATAVDHTTVRFEGASETHMNRRSGKPRRHEEDVDNDGDTDLVFHFRLGDTALGCSSTDGILTGEAFDGTPIELTDSVRMVGGTTVITVGQPIP